MKPLSAAAIAIVLATSPFAFGQEESPSPSSKLGLRATDPTSRSEPTVSVPSERSADDYPKPGTIVASPTPSRSTAASSPSPSPAKSASRSKPAASKGASPSPPPAPVAKGAEPAVRQLENKWLTALQSHDTGAVQPLVADNYIGVTSGGKFVNKSGLLAEIKKDTNSYQSATNARMDVRIHGETAVVVGTTRQSGKDASGKSFTYTARWTDTWALRDGQWLCVASQSMQVPR